MSAGTPLLQVKNLQKHFPVFSQGFVRRQTGLVKAVDDISFDLMPGETLGLVGESGCGKTTTGRTILRALDPTAGEVLFHDGERTVDLAKLSTSELKPLRTKMQMIFQDPFGSLNPRMTVGKIIEEPLGVHKIGDSKQERRDRVAELLHLVGLSPNHSVRYPHEFSGGQRQRIALARALAVQPTFLVCDEPVSALDVSIQAQIINLFLDLQDQLGVAYLFISHDLKVVRQISDRIAVMYLGRIVELAPSADLYAHPLHPYSRALLSAVPVLDPDVAANRKRIILAGDVPSPVDPPSGCHFHPRCPWAEERCSVEDPVQRELSPGHFVACHLAEEIEAAGGELSGQNNA